MKQHEQTNTYNLGNWTKQEDERLKELYGKYSHKEIAEDLNRRPSSIRNRITDLGIAKEKKHKKECTIKRPPAVYDNVDVNKNLDYWANYGR